MGFVQTEFGGKLDPKWWVMVSVGVGSLLGAIDISVVNLSLPVIRHDLGSSVAMVQWVVSIYLLVICGLLLAFGRLGDLYGYKRLYIFGFLVFTVASALCGLAWSVPR